MRRPVVSGASAGCSCSRVCHQSHRGLEKTWTSRPDVSMSGHDEDKSEGPKEPEVCPQESLRHKRRDKKDVDKR
eukprot:2768428-Prorocentrum_lima.AAC.1